MGTCGPDTATATKARTDAHQPSPCMVASTAAGCVTATHGPVRDHASAAVYKYTRSVVPERTTAPGVGLPCDVANVTLGNPVVARYLRIRAVGWVGKAPSMRVSLQGCEDAVPDDIILTNVSIDATNDPSSVDETGLPDGASIETAKTELKGDAEKAEAAVKTFEDTLDMDDAATEEACKSMVENCDCNYATTRLGDFGLMYSCANATCCMVKRGVGAADVDQTRFCNDETFCDNDDSYHIAVRDDGDINGWGTTAHGDTSSTDTKRNEVRRQCITGRTFE